MAGIHFRLRELPPSSLPFWLHILRSCDSTGKVILTAIDFAKLVRRNDRPLSQTLRALLTPHLMVRKHGQTLTRYIPLGMLAHNTERETIVVHLHPELVPLVDDLRAEIEMNDLENMSKLRSPYAQNLYKLVNHRLKQLADTGEIKAVPRRGGHEAIRFEILLGDLRAQLEVPRQSYLAFSDLKRFVLGHALKQINKKTDLDLMFSNGSKDGRNYVSLIFSVKLRPPGKRALDVAPMYAAVPTRREKAKPALVRVSVPRL